jgi:hypothetical protein
MAWHPGYSMARHKAQALHVKVPKAICTTQFMLHICRQVHPHIHIKYNLAYVTIQHCMLQEGETHMHHGTKAAAAHKAGTRHNLLLKPGIAMAG